MPLKIAILGTGKVARSNYLPYLSRQQDVILTYFSRTRVKAEECARDFGGRVTGSIQELLEDEPDTVLVLTHETQRFEATSSLLAGQPKRIFFEKPLVAQNGQANVCEDDFYKARQLLQLADFYGIEIAMVFNYRFFDQTQRAIKIIAEQDFGKLTQASLFVNYACWSHCIDLLHLFGGRAAFITAFSGDLEYQNAVDVAGSFQLINGAMGTILGTNASNFEFPLYEIHLNFERGIINFSDLDGPLEVFTPGMRYKETYNLIGNHSRWDQYERSFQKSLDEYLDSIRQAVPPPVPGFAGLEELQFEAAIRRSINQKRVVDVQNEFQLEF